MKKILFIFLMLILNAGLMADDVFGFWKSVDNSSGKAQSIVAVYPYQGKCYGRLILTYSDQGQIKDTIYSPSERAPGVKGHPYYAGLDFIWNLKKNGNKYSGGEIMDPEKGRIYGAEMWRKGPNLIVRGELLFFGVNQTWPPANDNDFPPGFQKPDLATLVPIIPQKI